MAASKTTKKRKGKTATKQQSAGNRFQTEILILVMFAACLILMISAFGMGGIVGNAIRRFLPELCFLPFYADFYSFLQKVTHQVQLLRIIMHSVRSIIQEEA